MHMHAYTQANHSHINVLKINTSSFRNSLIIEKKAFYIFLQSFLKMYQISILLDWTV